MRSALPILLLVGCTPSRAVKPLPRGATQLTASLGGPLTADLGPTIPLPLTNVGVVHGVDGLTNVHATVHPSGLAVRTFGGSVGVARQVWDQRGASPRLMADATLSAFVGDAVPGGESAVGRVFTDVSGVLSWDLGRHSVYTGLDVFVQPSPTPTAHLTPLVGTVLRPGRMGVQLEAEWLAPYIDNRPLATNWKGIGHRGALQLTVGLTYTLGGRP